MSKGQSLQDPFLNALRRERVPVSVYLVNGIKLQVDLPIAEAEKLAASADGAPIRALLPEKLPEW